MNNLCEYGCGQKSKHQFKNGKWCCSSNTGGCPEITKKRILKIKEKWKNEKHPNKGNIPWNKGTVGKQISWNKGLTKETDDRIKTISKSLTGKKLSKKHRNNLSISKKKLYNNKKNHPSYKGRYYSENIPLYDTYNNQLTIEEKSKRYKNDKQILTVICTNCKKRFIPKLSSVSERVRSLKGMGYGENRLYCSEECKQKCSIFNKHIYQDGHPNKKPYTESEYQTFRRFVLERDNHICQYCGKLATDVHHERPQKLEPFFALDPDYAWSCCKECHYDKGHPGECSTGSIAHKICKDNNNNAS